MNAKKERKKCPSCGHWTLVKAGKIAVDSSNDTQVWFCKRCGFRRLRQIMVKLSKAQAKMLRLMREGYELSRMGCTVGHVGWTNLVRLTQHNYPDGLDREVKGNFATLKALEKRGLIKNITNKPMDSLNFYAPTQRGRKWTE